MKNIYLILLLFLFNNYLISQNIIFSDPNFKYSLVNEFVVDIDGNGSGDTNADTNNDGEIDIQEAESVINLLFWFNDYSSVKELENFINLEKLLFYDNNLSTINLSKNSKLKELRYIKNENTEIDLSKNLDLEFLDLNDNKLTNLDVSKNVLLYYIGIDSNNLTSFDTSQNSNLTVFRCTNNKLEYLNIKNSKNSILTDFNSTGNTNLSCIQVDDIDYSKNQTTWFKDDSSSYQTDCNLLSVADYNFSNEIKFHPNPTDNSIEFDSKYFNEIKTVEIFDLNGKIILQKKKDFKTLELTNLIRGVYIIKITTEYSSITKKIVKL